MERLIDAVRRFPCLWNTAAIEYRDQELKDAAWAEVMKETDLSSVKEVKLKWKKLRDSYRDALKRQSDSLARDPANPTKKINSWKYMAHMQFLQPYMSNRLKKSSPPPLYHTPAASATNGDQHSSDESDSDGGSSPKRKGCERDQLVSIDRKLDYLCKTSAKRRCVDGGGALAPERRRSPPPPPDPLDIFFNSMCQSTKRLPFHTQIKIKRTLFEAVAEAEQALLAEHQNYAALWTRGAASDSASEPDAS